jgi:lipoyl(octanoyl) transferase
MPNLQFKDLGSTPYQEALGIQQRHFEQLLAVKRSKEMVDNAGVLLLCEHPPVYTLGRNGKEENLITSKENLGVEVHRIGRGGDITYHGPGQLVGYPLLDLEKWPMGLASYVFKLEEVIIQTLAHYGLKADRTAEAPGVWLDYTRPAEARKICALGIQASRWITMHGFAFNINTDLNYFNHIIPCGIPEKQVTSMEKELGAPLDMNEVKEVLKGIFRNIFEVEWSAYQEIPIHEI